MSLTPKDIINWCTAPERKEITDWNINTMKSTLESIKQARAEIPKNPHNIIARWDYPDVIEELETYIIAFEAWDLFGSQIEAIESRLEAKKILPNEDWLVERSRLRLLGYSDAEIEKELVKGKLSAIVPIHEWENKET